MTMCTITLSTMNRQKRDERVGISFRFAASLGDGLCGRHIPPSPGGKLERLWHRPVRFLEERVAHRSGEPLNDGVSNLPVPIGAVFD